MRTSLLSAVLLSACIPMKASSTEPSSPAPAAEAAAIAESWDVDFSHSTANKSISDSASLEFSGQAVTIAKGYQTPWHGTCAEATRIEKSEPIADAIRERAADLEGTTRMRFGGGDARVITLTCADGSTPTMDLVIGNLGNFAMTCIADVCHTLKAK